MDPDFFRNRGYTSWILKAALINPEVFIVFNDEKSKHHAITQFSNLSYELEQKKFLTEGRKIERLREWPKFLIITQIEDNTRGYRRNIPIIFDNSCFD